MDTHTLMKKNQILLDYNKIVYCLFNHNNYSHKLVLKNNTNLFFIKQIEHRNTYNIMQYKKIPPKLHRKC